MFSRGAFFLTTTFAFHFHLVLVGKKNLEVRPIAINKGEIVKRLLYTNPDAEWVFCAGDDKVRGVVSKNAEVKAF